MNNKIKIYLDYLVLIILNRKLSEVFRLNMVKILVIFTILQSYNIQCIYKFQQRLNIKYFIRMVSIKHQIQAFTTSFENFPNKSWASQNQHCF